MTSILTLSKVTKSGFWRPLTRRWKISTFEKLIMQPDLYLPISFMVWPCMYFKFLNCVLKIEKHKNVIFIHSKIRDLQNMTLIRPFDRIGLILWIFFWKMLILASLLYRNIDSVNYSKLFHHCSKLNELYLTKKKKTRIWINSFDQRPGIKILSRKTVKAFLFARLVKAFAREKMRYCYCLSAHASVERKNQNTMNNPKLLSTWLLIQLTCLICFAITWRWLLTLLFE